MARKSSHAVLGQLNAPHSSKLPPLLHQETKRTQQVIDRKTDKPRQQRGPRLQTRNRTKSLLPVRDRLLQEHQKCLLRLQVQIVQVKQQEELNSLTDQFLARGGVSLIPQI